MIKGYKNPGAFSVEMKRPEAAVAVEGNGGAGALGFGGDGGRGLNR